VGCDSRQFRSKTVFVTVVVVHINSNHGAKIFWRVDKVRRITSINPNPDHRSSMIVKEAVGYVLAQGLKPVLKPDAVAASAVADFFTGKF